MEENKEKHDQEWVPHKSCRAIQRDGEQKQFINHQCMLVFYFLHFYGTKLIECEERGSPRLSPTSLPPPLPAHICCWGDGTLIQREELYALEIRLHGMAAYIGALWKRSREEISRWRIFIFSLTQPESCLQFGVMSQYWCRQALLRVEVGMLVAFLVAVGTAQIYETREAGSSCYGGFDLYFVLDKWVLIPLLCGISCLLYDSSEFVLTSQVFFQVVLTELQWATTCQVHICPIDFDITCKTLILKSYSESLNQ